MSPAAASTQKRERVPRQRAPRTTPEVRRELLLDVAESILAAQGSDALRMDNLARTAGVTRPVVYEHFSNRDDLIVALLERHGRRLSEGESRTDAADTSFPDFLIAATRAYLETALMHGPAMRALVSGEQMSPAIERARRRVWNRGSLRWAHLYSEQFDLQRDVARALAVSHLAGLSSLAGMCIEGTLGIETAIELHAVSALGSLRAVSMTGAHS